MSAPTSIAPESFHSGLREALRAARAFEGATSPNPPVGCAALSSDGTILALGAHERAGSPHAEAQALAACTRLGLKPETLIVTLEPCNHTGRTPPCTDAILNLASEGSLKRVVYASSDPNPLVSGKGLERLQAAGLEVLRIEDPGLRAQCDRLVAPFSKWMTTRRPWVTVKSAFNPSGTMLPKPGQKTFTSESSLILAHQLRRRADAILTGSGTVLADAPEFTVRRVPDFPGKRRWLVVMDRKRRVPSSWIQLAEARGFKLKIDCEDLEKALDFLGSQGVLEVLVEAGPELTHSLLSASLWDEHVIISQAMGEGNPDHVETVLRSN